MWKKLKPKLFAAVIDVIVHFVITALSIISLALIHGLIWVTGMGEHHVIDGIQLSDWMLKLEVLSATAIISVGTVKAVLELWKE
jgi:hypothetical protein